MGGMGVVSRLAGESYGSAATFGAAAQASAPGQVGIADLAKVLDTVQRMNYFAYVAGRSVQPFVQEIQMWSEHLARAQA